MSFATLTFLVFLALVFALYWLRRERRWQNTLLVLASYLFYGWWDFRFCSLMLVSSLIDFSIGWGLGISKMPSRRKALLVTSIVANLGLLGIFKYFNFFAENLQLLFSSLGWNLGHSTLKIVLPVGISFYTFQTLSYTIDIYRGNLKPSRSLIDYLAFVSFFPQLVAGPIERASRLLPQFSAPRQFNDSQAADGCRLILWGLFKKIAIADRLAVLVDQRYATIELMQGPDLAFATVCFAFQIYCDFSAYSDIAIGTAKLFNIELMRNFAYPYFSQSIGEFWRRWHISLSTWFRDYVFIPLGGSRTGTVRRSLNTLLTFLVSGLWHGAAWQYVAWGGVNGVFTVGEGFRERDKRMTRDDVPGGATLIPRPATLLRMLLTFTIVCSAWVFFRADTLGDAFLIFQKIASDAFSASAYQTAAIKVREDNFACITIAVLVIFIVVEWCQRRHVCPLERSTWPLPMRWATYTLLIWTTLELLPASGGQAFVYFEF